MNTVISARQKQRDLEQRLADGERYRLALEAIRYLTCEKCLDWHDANGHYVELHCYRADGDDSPYEIANRALAGG